MWLTLEVEVKISSCTHKRSHLCKPTFAVRHNIITFYFSLKPPFFLFYLLYYEQLSYIVWICLNSHSGISRNCFSQ